MPERKDISFFGTDLNFTRPRISREEYLLPYRQANGALRIGESSVWYLYSRTAAQEIKSFAPSASIIVMLREPVEMLYAQHSQFLYNCNEDIPDFGSALEAENDRKQGERIPRQSHFVEGLFYRETIKYAEQVERYFEVFGRENVHVMLYDDFEADTARAFRDTLGFLGVEPATRPDFQIINPCKKVRSRRLQEFLVAPSPVLARIFRLVTPPFLRGHLLKRLKGLNTQYKRRPPLDPVLRRCLQVEFQPEVQRLSALLGRDLGSWSN
jgi:hypothetical protein